MNDKFLTALLITIVPTLTFAQGTRNYQCSYGDMERRVEILSEPGVTVPCEVHYYKDTELPGVRQVLWRAANEAGYCERKTQEFIAGLQESGWDCGQKENAAQAAEPEMTEAPTRDDTAAPNTALEKPDDTAVLIPADDTESTGDDMN